MVLENTLNNALAKLPILKAPGKNGNSWVPIPVTTPPESGTSTTTKMTASKSLLLVGEILGVVTPPEDLNVKFLRSLPSEWDTHVVVWMNKPDFDTMGLDDPVTQFKIVDTGWECRAPRSKDNRNWNQCSSTKTVKIEDASKKAMCAIDGASFDWENMAEDEIQEIWLSCFLSSEYDDLLVKLSDTDFKAATYKRGLATLEVQIVKYKEHEVLFSEEIALLKRSVEKDGVDFKIAKFDKYAKDLNEMLEGQITDKSKKGIGYNAVPSPHPLILNRPTTLDLSYSGLEEFKEPEVNEYGPRDSSLKPTIGCDKESDNFEENTDDSLEQHQMTDTETSSFETPLKVDKDWKEKFFSPANM
ncbi:hypothetical protein Tco_0676355 [Tanacetum coccineum]